MVRTSSSKSAAPASAAPAVASSATPSVKKAAAPKKEKAVKEESAPAVSAAAAAAVPASDEENKVISETSEVASKLVELTAQVHQLTNILSATKGNLKVLEK